MLGHFQMSRCRHCRVGAMSKVELAGRPEPGYESMEQFTVNVEHVAEMLRTIDFQPGGGARKGERPRAAGTERQDPPGGGGVGHEGQTSKDSTSRGLPSAQALPGRKRMRNWCWTEKRAALGQRKTGGMGRKVSVARGALRAWLVHSYPPPPPPPPVIALPVGPEFTCSP